MVLEFLGGSYFYQWAGICFLFYTFFLPFLFLDLELELVLVLGEAVFFPIDCVFIGCLRVLGAMNPSSDVCFLYVLFYFLLLSLFLRFMIFPGCRLRPVLLLFLIVPRYKFSPFSIRPLQLMKLSSFFTHAYLMSLHDLASLIKDLLCLVKCSLTQISFTPAVPFLSIVFDQSITCSFFS